MAAPLNQESINDAAKLMVHRLIARVLARDPSLIDQARASHALIKSRFPERTFGPEWDGLLQLPADQLRCRLTSRDPTMYRLRLSSPLVVAEGIDFTDEGLRRRIRRAAKRVVERGMVRVQSDVGSAR